MLYPEQGTLLDQSIVSLSLSLTTWIFDVYLNQTRAIMKSVNQDENVMIKYNFLILLKMTNQFKDKMCLVWKLASYHYFAISQPQPDLTINYSCQQTTLPGFFINKVFIVYFYRKKKCFNHHTLQALHLPVQRIILIQKHCNIWFNGMEDRIHSGEEARLEDESSHHDVSLILTRQELPDWEQSHVLQNSVNLQNIQFYLCLFLNIFFYRFKHTEQHQSCDDSWNQFPDNFEKSPDHCQSDCLQKKCRLYYFFSEQHLGRQEDFPMLQKVIQWSFSVITQDHCVNNTWDYKMHSAQKKNILLTCSDPADDENWLNDNSQSKLVHNTLWRQQLLECYVQIHTKIIQKGFAFKAFVNRRQLITNHSEHGKTVLKHAELMKYEILTHFHRQIIIKNQDRVNFLFQHIV